MRRSPAFPVVSGLALAVSLVVPATRSPAQVPTLPAADARPVAVRIEWGGGQPSAWSGTITLVDERGGSPRELAWRTLCIEPDAAAMAHAEGPTLVVHQPRPVATDGVEITVPDVRGWRIVAAIGPSGGQPVRADVALADLFLHESSQPLDSDGNRLTIRPATGEQLRATLVAADGSRDATVLMPGERVRLTVDPLLPVRADATSAVELRLRLTPRRGGADILAQAAPLVPRDTAADADPATAGGRRVARFDPVFFDLTLPPNEAAWSLELEAVEGGGFGWARPLAARTLGLTTVAADPPARDVAGWRVVYELDPGSPRLHERLRRLPGTALPSVQLPHVPLPSLARPALPRLPQIPLPSVPLPQVPLPQVSLPQVPSLSAMVPRLSGLLAAGHSRVEVHELGPMLELPPAESADAPAWEGIVVAGAQPAMPHVVEIEFPTDQAAEVAVTVLELDAAGSRVESRHAGGFAVGRRFPKEAPRLDVHRFVFWPATRHPVVLLANQSPSASARVGRVRILAGPTRLPPATPATGRRVHAFLADPAARDFGGSDGDAATRVAAIERSVESLAAQGAAGAVFVVHGEGASLWPSRCTREAPRWGCGAAESGGAAADLLTAACRLYGRAGLRLVPAISCDAPLATLEAELARGGPQAAGIVCVGRDGRARRIGPLGLTHYNVLDPRVQRAVEELVGELAGRLRGSSAVDGVAVLLPHDGWLHLPGVAWPLDDATFARFRAAAGVEEPEGGDNRFAARAALVEGPLRERWLDWRAGEVARFHARLAEILAAHDDRWSLLVVPTTLCVEGGFAERVRPSLLRAAADAAALRESGLDPVRVTTHRRVVFVAPHVHGAASLGDRGVLDAGNAVASQAAASAARRGVVVLGESRTLDVRSMVPHGPFGSAEAPESIRVRIAATGAEAGRPLAEAFAAADAEVVCDARLGLALPALRTADRAAIEALPVGPLTPVAGLPAPLVVRTARGDATWVHVINAAGVPTRATLAIAGRATDVMDMGTGAALEPHGSGLTLELPAWGMRALRLGGEISIAAARLDYAADVTEAVASRVARLVSRRDALEQPLPLDVLDNPGFELGTSAGEGRLPSSLPTGWELVEPRRGSVVLTAGAGDTGRGACFTSTNGLSTLRSNPFPPPASGRASVAAWLRIRDGDQQPPLRMALEGIRDEREYYRFAAVGGLAGGRPLTGEWQQFVLQVDDLPDAGLESLRVRFDLLGPGAVEIDDVRVFDLAFTEPERVRLSRQIAALQAALEAGDLGLCIAALEGHWPRFLEAHVPVPAVEKTATAPPSGAAPTPAARTGVLDRMWRWWQ